MLLAAPSASKLLIASLLPIQKPEVEVISRRKKNFEVIFFLVNNFYHISFLAADYGE